MKTNLEICNETEEILKKLDNIYGANKCKDILRNYIAFLSLKKREKIKYGNSNILIRNRSEYGSAYEVVEIINEILKTQKIIKHECRYLKRDDLRKNLDEAMKKSKKSMKKNY